MKVYLETYEIENAVRVGTGRYNMRKDSQDKSYYNNDRKQNDLLAMINSAVAECAVAKATNQYWHGGVWCNDRHQYFKHQADVGNNIEVRRLREPNNPVPVRRNDILTEKVVYGVYVKDFEYEEIDILGYIDAQQGWDIGTRPSWDRYDDNRVVSIDKLTVL